MTDTAQANRRRAVEQIVQLSHAADAYRTEQFWQQFLSYGELWSEIEEVSHLTRLFDEEIVIRRFGLARIAELLSRPGQLKPDTRELISAGLKYRLLVEPDQALASKLALAIYLTLTAPSPVPYSAALLRAIITDDSSGLGEVGTMKESLSSGQKNPGTQTPESEYERGCLAFARELPSLLATHYGKCVVYSVDRRFGPADDFASIEIECRESGADMNEVLYRVIEPDNIFDVTS